MLRSTSSPAVLLSLTLTLLAASPRPGQNAGGSETAAPAPSATEASLTPAALDVPIQGIEAPASTASTASKAAAEPAAATPAVLSNPMAVFAKGAEGLSPQVLSMALDAVSCAKANGTAGRDDLLTVIDYSLPSTEPRLWVLDLQKGQVLFHELVAHGAGTGDKYATRFSNVMDSRQTSLGLFLTGGTYEGGNGYSMKLRGLNEGINDRAEERHIVMHGAWYVSEEHARRQGRLGRSWGCPALSQDIAPTVIDTIKGGSFVFSYSGSNESMLRTASTGGGSCGSSPSNPTSVLATVATAL